MEDKKYDLEDRSFDFAKRVLKMTKALPKDKTNEYYTNQIIRSSGSSGANYREANDALGDKDFIFRMKIVRKEAKESTYWIRLIMEHNVHLVPRIENLLQESIELTKIYSSIIKNKQNKHKD